MSQQAGPATGAAHIEVGMLRQTLRRRAVCTGAIVSAWFAVAFSAVEAIRGSAHGGVIASFVWSVQAAHDRHDLYSSGFATAPVRNVSPNFLASGCDLTGVGFVSNNGLQAVTMISPQHFVMAAHFPPSTNLVRFVTADNQLRTYTIHSTAVLPTMRFNGQLINAQSDLLVGRLKGPIAPEDGIGYFPIAYDPDTDLIDGPIPVTHRFRSARLLCQGFNGAYPGLNGFTSPHLGSNILGHGPYRSDDGPGLATVTFDFAFDPVTPGEFHSIDGDSGSPSFVPVNNRLALVGLHYDLLNDNTSVDTFVPFYLPGLAAFMDADGIKPSILELPRRFPGIYRR